ncbi:hypothetical protein CAAN1_01S05270 [[Candida] anglica]|uniref:Acyl-coenzyme A diphosphatase SCS3 n=1 Tax=[Candida] anglica TaxID=148631 RepID=A0ABP0EJM1_9ASCO
MPPTNQVRYDKDLQKLNSFTQHVSQKWKVTITELAYISSFVVSVLVGKVIHVCSQKEEVYNYFNDKRNFFNQYFVKKGWGWTTLVIVIFYALTLKKGSNLPIGKVLRRAVINYLLVTVWWIFFTQWFFGFPIMDRVFLWTGGKCAGIEHERLVDHSTFTKNPSFFQQLEETTLFETQMVSSYVCRSLKGSWSGGHDPSGHVFLLVHSSLYLVFESLPFWESWTRLKLNTRQLISNVRNSPTISSKLFNLLKFIAANPNILVILLVSLWWWMLFMTCIYFHSIAEKFVGLIFGYAAFSVLYILPRWI